MQQIEYLKSKPRLRMQNTFTDGSMIITEACVRSGADVYIGYPITPSNLLYSYAKKRYPLFYAAPDEITTSQWMAGFAAAGKMPVTATSFPGLALMIETLNMAFAMELPMVLIIAQRLGPSTGSATTGSQGDLSLLNACISGGYSLPVFCPSDFTDCWNLAHKSVETAVKLRTPAILLTSKEMIMTNRSFDTKALPEIKQIRREISETGQPYQPYKPGDDFVPPFIAVGNNKHRVRLNASTHDFDGLIRKNSPEAISNTQRLKFKLDKRIEEFAFYEHIHKNDADKLIVTYGISAYAVRDALPLLNNHHIKCSILIMKTLLPIPPSAIEIMNKYNKLIFVEENVGSQLREIIFGKVPNANITGVNKIGSMITPEEITEHMIMIN